MRHYETLFIISPECSEEDLKGIDSKFQGVVAGMKGRVLAYSERGKKKLAYSVKKHGKGYYVLMDYAGGSDLVAEVERNMRLDDRILKYLTVKLADEVSPELLQAAEPESEAAGQQ